MSFSNTKVLKFFAAIYPISFLVISIILGFISEGYDIQKHTLSRLLIHKYGLIQMINFILLSISVLIAGNIISARLKVKKSVNTVKIIFYLTSLTLFLVAIFTPTNIDKTIPNVHSGEMTLSGYLHILTVVFFVVISPFLINKLAKIFDSESKTKNLSKTTTIMGYSAFFAAIVWLIFYYFGFLWQYKGILQKILVLWVIIWIEKMIGDRPKVQQNAS